MNLDDLEIGSKYRLISYYQYDIFAKDKPHLIGRVFTVDESHDAVFENSDEGALYLDDGFEAEEVCDDTIKPLTTTELAYLDKVTKSLHDKDVNVLGKHLVGTWNLRSSTTDEEMKPTTSQKIQMECDALKNLLLEKNRKYGDSALNDGIVFNIPPITAIEARINDKIARLKNVNHDENEDVILDLLGYFILLRIALKDKK